MCLIDTLIKFMGIHWSNAVMHFLTILMHFLLFRNVSIPESILKKRKAVEKQAVQRLANRAAQIKKNKKVSTIAFKRAEEYANEYLQKEREAIRMKREAKTAGNIYVPEQPKLAFVIRIKG